jgi:hypothetical protein
MIARHMLAVAASNPTWLLPEEQEAVGLENMPLTEDVDAAPYGPPHHRGGDMRSQFAAVQVTGARR